MLLSGPRATVPLTLMGIGAVAVGSRAFGPPAMLAGLVGAGAIALFAVRPELATMATMFLLYLNVPAILTQRHGVPEAAAGAMILLLALPLASHCMLRRERFKFGQVFALMLVYLIALTVSATGAVDRGIAAQLVQGFVLEGLLLYWLVINVVRDLPTLRRVFVALLAAGAIVSALCFYQDATGSYSQDFGGLAHRNYEQARDAEIVRLGQERGRFSRAQGQVNEPNRFAQIMVVLLPFAWYLFRTATSRSARAVFAMLGAAVLCGVVLTLSRGALVAIGLMAGLLVVVGWIRASRLTLAAIAALVLLPLVNPYALERITSLANVTALGSDPRAADGALRGRATEMYAALYVFMDHPLVGVGPGQFAPFYVEDYSSDPEIQFRDLREPRKAHSLYLELLAETGAIGLLAFIAVVGVVLSRLWAARRVFLSRAPQGADLVTACWLSLIGYLITATFLHLSYQRYFWLLLGLCVASIHILAALRPSAAAELERT